MTLTPRSPQGFTLVEALVATALVTTAAVALAQLLTLGVRQSGNTREAFAGLVLAQSKLEAIRALPWSYTVPGGDLSLSPIGSLSNDIAGYVDYPARFARRWAVTLLDPADADVVVIDVCVFAADRRTAAPEACVSTLRTRRP